MLFKSSAGAIALALLVLAVPSAAQPGTCKGNKRDECPSNAEVCFNNVGGQTVTIDSSGTWTVDISQCFKSSAVSFITWSPVDESGKCSECNGRKVEEVAPGTMLFSDVLTTYSADSCTGTPFCVYVHDGSLQKGKDGTPLGDVPETCFSSSNQLCAMCSYIVTPTRKEGSCNNGVFCDGMDVCNGAGDCVPAVADADPCAETPLGSANPLCAQPACDESTGCFVEFINEGGSCTDGNFCNGAEICDMGNCAAPDPTPCDDYAAGTFDTRCAQPACDEVLQCFLDPINEGGSCTDGMFCNGPEMCSSGSCVPDGSAACADTVITADDGCSKIVCTEDSGCQEEILTGSGCNDGDACTTGDTCTAAGKCEGTDPCPGDCQTCDGNGGCIDAQEGRACVNPNAAPGTKCGCDGQGGCSKCFTDCVGSKDENTPGCAADTTSACVVDETTNSAGTNCGDNCDTLCSFVCNGALVDPRCSAAGGCTCKGAVSPFDASIIDTGPCCMCTQC